MGDEPLGVGNQRYRMATTYNRRGGWFAQPILYHNAMTGMFSSKRESISPTTETRGILRSPISYTLEGEPPIIIRGNLWSPATLHYRGDSFPGHVILRPGESELGRELKSLSLIGVPVVLADSLCDHVRASGGFCQWSRLILLGRGDVNSLKIPPILTHETEHARAFIGAERGSLQALTEFSYIKRPGHLYGEFVVNEIQAHMDELCVTYHRDGPPTSILQKIPYLFSRRYESFSRIRSFLRDGSEIVRYFDNLPEKRTLAEKISHRVRSGDMYFPTAEIPIPSSSDYVCCLALPKRAERLPPEAPELLDIIVERMDAFCARIKDQSAMLRRSHSWWGIPASHYFQPKI